MLFYIQIYSATLFRIPQNRKYAKYPSTKEQSNKM